MIHRCPNCPNTSNLTTYLANLLIDIEWSSDDKEIDADYEIQFQQWIYVDRSQLVQQSLPVKEFIKVLVEKLREITIHSFITKAQARYLKTCKEQLQENEIKIHGK